MNRAIEQTQGRRQFFRSAVRYTLLGGALVLVRALTGRPAGASAKCFKTGVCRSCAAFQSCEQPQAGETRRQVS